MAKYEYLTKLSTEIESKVIEARKNNPQYSLNAVINKLLSDHFKIKGGSK